MALRSGTLSSMAVDSTRLSVIEPTELVVSVYESVGDVAIF